MAMASERAVTAQAGRRVAGRLSLGFSSHEASTRLHVYEQRPPLKVIRAFPVAGGGALLHLHNLSGGVLGGDHLELDVELGPRAYAQLTSTSATRLYRSSPDAPASLQTNHIRVGRDALLEYLPDPLIPFADSDHQQSTHIDLAEGAGLFWWEMVAPGREARGEVFAYRQLRLHLDITAEGRPLASERIKLEPQQRPLTSLARLGPYRYFSSFYICRVGLEAAQWSHLESALSALACQNSLPGEILWGVSQLVAHGLVVKALSRQGRDITAGLYTFWHAARRLLYGREALPPRKIY